MGMQEGGRRRRWHCISWDHRIDPEVTRHTSPGCGYNTCTFHTLHPHTCPHTLPSPLPLLRWIRCGCVDLTERCPRLLDAETWVPASTQRQRGVGGSAVELQRMLNVGAGGREGVGGSAVELQRMLNEIARPERLLWASMQCHCLSPSVCLTTVPDPSWTRHHRHRSLHPSDFPGDLDEGLLCTSCPLVHLCKLSPDPSLPPPPPPCPTSDLPRELDDGVLCLRSPSACGAGPRHLRQPRHAADDLRGGL